MSPTRAVPCWYESGKIIFDREVKAEPKLLRILFDSDDLNSARTHPELDKTVKRAWQVDDDSYFGALRRAPRVLDDVGRNPSSLTDYCHGLRAVLAPALDEDGVRVDDARKNDRASLLLALVRGLLPIAAPTPPRTATTIQPGISDHVAGGEDEGNLERTGRLALATSLGLVGRAAGPHSIRACANEMTARALLSVFDNIAAKALAVLVRSWRKQRLTHMPLKDLFEAALNALKIEPPSSKEIASYLALAVAVVGSALSSRKTTTTPREDDWLREIVGENGDSTRRRALLDETLNTILSDPAVERRAVAQATLLRDLIKPKG